MLLTEQMKSLMKRNASLGGMLIPAESKFALKVCIFCCSTKFSHVRKKKFQIHEKTFLVQVRVRSAVENIKGTEYAAKVSCVPIAIVVRDAR